MNSVKFLKKHLFAGLVLPVLAVLALTYAGCSSTTGGTTAGTIPPAYETALNTKGKPFTMNAFMVEMLIHSVLDKENPEFDYTLSDPTYSIPTRRWMRQFNQYFFTYKNRLASNGRLNANPNWGDCDDYAKLYISQTLLSNPTREHQFPPLVAKVNLVQRSGALHQAILYITADSTGPSAYIYDPMSGRETHLGKVADLFIRPERVARHNLYALYLD